MTISISSRKAKGRHLQKYVAKRISEITGIASGKDEMIASREMGQSGSDVRLIGKAKKLFPFSIECKYQETWSVPAWIQQAKKNWKRKTDWLLFMRKNRHEEIVCMDAEAFFKFYKEYLNLKKSYSVYESKVAPLIIERKKPKKEQEKTCVVKKRRG